MFNFITTLFIILLTSIGNASKHRKVIRQTLHAQQRTTQLTLINLHPNEYTQRLRYFPFAVNLDRCIGSRDTLNNLANKVCVPNKV